LDREVKKLQKDRGLKSVDLKFDEEHNLWELRFVNKHGAEQSSLGAGFDGRVPSVDLQVQTDRALHGAPFVVEVVAKAASASSNGDEAANGEPSDTS